jgi:hypothetical protein
MRAARDLLRRRIHLMRQRAELLAHVQNTNSQYNLPEIGKKIAYKANRHGFAERYADPAVHKSIEVDLALITYYDQLLTDNEAGQQYLARLEKKHDKSKALTILAHELARAVYDMLRRETVFAMDNFLCG